MLKLFIQGSDLPINLCILLLLLGFFLLRGQKGNRIAKGLTLTVVILLVLLTNGIVPNFLLSRLENKFPPLLSSKTLGATAMEIQYVVVLGGLAQPERGWPVTSQIGGTMLVRLVEGIRLFRELPQSRLLLSGGGRGRVSDAEIMRDVALALGVDPGRILMETESTDTAEEAFLLKDLLANKKFILVTSARHMPRAMAIFLHAGLDPVPAPTNHLAVPFATLEWSAILPRASNMGLFGHVLYEYLALLKAQLTHKV